MAYIRFTKFGSKFYYNDYGKLHRGGGPAAIWSNSKVGFEGEKKYYRNGKLHREDGPAIENLKSNKYIWFYNGKQINCSSQIEFERYLKLKCFW